MKVLMVGPDRGVHGGISAVVNELYDAGLGNQIDLEYIGTMKEGSRFNKLVVAGCAFLRFLVALPSADVVHVHFSSDSSFVRKSYFIKAAHKFGKRIVLHQHGGDFKNYYGKELDAKGRKHVKNILEMGDVMLVLTKSWKDFFSGIVDQSMIEVFPNGVRTVGCAASEKFEKDYSKILFLGRICKDKGIDELLEAVEDIYESGRKVKLLVGGIFEERGYREKIASAAAFAEFIGWVSGAEKDKYLQECGILVLPSYYEGFPVSIIEAMLRRSAVVASCVGGIPDIIDDGINGLLVPAKDPKALEESLIKLIDDNKLAKELGENGRNKVVEHYSVEENIKRLIEIYTNLTCD